MRRRRGVTLLWFVLIGMPFLMFSLALTSEVSKVVVAGRQVRLAAENAAVAGAFQFDRSGSGDLDQAKARQVASETFSRAVSEGMVKAASVIRHWPVTTSRQVSYNVRFRVPGLTILRLFRQEGDVYIVTERADVCVPGQHQVTGGYCRRPESA